MKGPVGGGELESGEGKVTASRMGVETRGRDVAVGGLRDGAVEIQATMAPFFSAARLTSACFSVKGRLGPIGVDNAR